MKHTQHLWASVMEALQADGGLAVFRHYGFEPSRRPQRFNPFRQERTSSFFVGEKAGTVFFKDFGDDAYKGNAWKFVQLYEQTQDKERVLEILCGIYGVGSSPVPRVLPARPSPTPKTARKDFEKQLHSIDFKPFTKQELAYWRQKGGITQEILEANHVQSVRAFRIEVAAGKFAEYRDLQFVFAYEIVAGKAYKLYMPKPEHRVYAQSKTVFLPSLQPAREIFGENFAYSFGLETLTQAPFLLCGGEADCLALKTLGYNAMTLGDERASVPVYIWESLREQWDIENPATYLQAVLYDTDFTGVSHSQKLAKAWQVPALVLPKLHVQTRPEQPKPKENDVCDYLGLYGFDASLRLELGKRHIRTRDYALPAVPRFGVGQYLSERIDVLAEFIQAHKRVQIDADTGVGKTYTFLSDLPTRLQKPILFAVPFAIQVEQIEREYSHIEDLICFTNQDTQALSEEDKFILMNRPTGKVNVCTIDRIKAVYERLEHEHGQDIILVIDESHLLTSEYGYRAQAIHDVLEVSKKVAKLVYLSATPDYSLCRFSGFRLIQFRRQENPCLQVAPLYYAGTAKQTLLQVLLSTTPNPSLEGGELTTPSPSLEGGEITTPSPSLEGGGKVTVVRLNNKTLAKVVANLLVAEGKYKTNEIDFVFSEKRRGQSTPARESIVNNSLIPEGVRLLFVTACFDCGINIKNTNVAQVISFETQYTDNCLDTLKQLVARFRDMKEIDVLVCKPQRLENLPALKPKANLYERLKRDAQAKLSLLPYLDEAQQNQLKQPPAKLPSYLKHNPDISAIHKLIHWNKRKRDYQINYNYIRFALKEYERKHLSGQDFFAYLQQELPCLTVCASTQAATPLRAEQKRQLSELLAKEKSQKEHRQALVTTAMQEQPALFFDAVSAAYRDQALKEKIKKHFSVSNIKDAPKLEGIFQEHLETLGQVEALDEEITNFSHRYFYLLDLRIPQTKIPSLLRSYNSPAKFAELTRALSNQIQLLAYREAGKDWENLVPDARKHIDTRWLADFVRQAVHWKPPQFAQKKNNASQTKLHDAQARQTALQKERQELQTQIRTLEEREKAGERCRSTLRDIKRKENALQNRLRRQAEQIERLERQREQSAVSGWEIEQLSERINRTRAHAADWQSSKINMRLLQSLFEVQTQKRAVLIANPQNPQESVYVEKTFVNIGQPLTFDSILQRTGFSPQEVQNYLQDLRYQIHIDLDNSAKQREKSTQAAIENIPIDASGENARAFAQTSAIVLNEHGYPLSWDL